MKVYSKQSIAEARAIRLMKDGLAGLVVVQVKTGWKVNGHPGIKQAEVPTSADSMESERVQEAALDIDETAINVHEIGETDAAPAAWLRGQ